MGNCIPSLDKERKTLPVDTIFKLPSPLPNWPPGGEFGSGYVDLEGLEVCQILTFNKVWAIDKGGPDNLGATFYEPSPIPDGFSMFGCYCQPNNQPHFGWVLVGKDKNNGQTLKNPIDYTLVWSSESSKLKNKNSTDDGYIWLPIPPEGYKTLGHVVTTSPEKPSFDKIQCVQSNFTDKLEVESWIWGEGTTSNAYGINVHSIRPQERGIKAQGVSVGTFLARIKSDQDDDSNTLYLACLKNNKFGTFSSMPSLGQIQALFQQYSPLVYFHPKEKYLPSSVNWYFANGALLYQKGEESNPSSIEPNGSNLPQGGPNDGAYWLDLPIDAKDKEKAIKGDLLSSEVYLHIKPMLGATFTDIAVWIFHPFNGPGTAKLGLIDVPLGKIGEHIGDWEHVTLRISNFNGVLHKVYLSQHSGGTWFNAPLVEFQNGNKVVAYSSLNGHAIYPKPGLVLQGIGDIGIRNDTAKSNLVLDCGENYSVVAAENLEIIEPPWLNYTREWGPKISYALEDEVKRIESLLKGNLKAAFVKLVKVLPNEVYGEEGPTGPKMKGNWNGDEV